MSEFFEEFPTPGDPIEGEEKDPGFDRKHRSKQGGSLREAKKFIGALISFLAPFEKRRIRTEDGGNYTILAIEDGVTADSPAQEWRIRENQGTAEVFIGTISGLGMNNDVPDGQTLYEWYQFQSANGPKYVVLEVTFTAQGEELESGWRLISGGTGGSVRIGILSQAQLNALEATDPTINVGTGATTGGEYHLVIGRAGGGTLPQNYRIGPITLFFCAPSSMGAISDGNDFIVSNP